MFGRWLRNGPPPSIPKGAEQIAHEVRAHLPDADEESVRVVTAITGLLGIAAYADRDFSELEERRVRSELSRVHGMTQAGIDAISDALKRHILEVSTVQGPRYCRTLVELADIELRREVLEVLVDVAAADGVLSSNETVLLRQLATALGLTQNDYNVAQEAHREKLAVLKGQST